MLNGSFAVQPLIECCTEAIQGCLPVTWIADTLRRVLGVWIQVAVRQDAHIVNTAINPHLTWNTTAASNSDNPIGFSDSDSDSNDESLPYLVDTYSSVDSYSESSSDDSDDESALEIYTLADLSELPRPTRSTRALPLLSWDSWREKKGRELMRFH